MDSTWNRKKMLSRKKCYISSVFTLLFFSQLIILENNLLLGDTMPAQGDPPPHAPVISPNQARDTQPQSNVPPNETSTSFLLNQNPLSSPTDEAEQFLPEQLISWMTIGWSGKNPKDRHVGWNIKKKGWTGFINEIMKPQFDWGVRRVLLHNPFGTLSGEVMQLDQLIHAKEAGLTWLYRDFVEAWKPYTSGTYGGPPIEVIAYVGYAGGDKDFKSLRNSKNPRAWLERAFESLEPILEAGMSVALDVAGGRNEDKHSMSYQLARRLRARGVKVYIEPRPMAAHTHWHDYPVISYNEFWKRLDPATHPKSRRASKEMLKGEVIRFMDHLDRNLLSGETKETSLKRLHNIMGKGHTVAMALWGRQFRNNFSMKDLLTNTHQQKTVQPPEPPQPPTVKNEPATVKPITNLFRVWTSNQNAYLNPSALRNDRVLKRFNQSNLRSLWDLWRKKINRYYLALLQARASRQK